MSRKVITLDVREDIKRGCEPFGKIMRTAAALKDTEDLRLIAPFEPTPLFRVLSQQGFSHQAKVTADGACEVLFTRNPGGAGAAEPAAAPSQREAPRVAPCGGSPMLEVDARGLEPPGPMVKILEAVATLPAGVGLSARTDRRPMHLYAQLEERGFVGQTEEEADGSFVTLIRSR